MLLHPNGQIQIPEEDYFIWEAYNFRCVICRAWAVCLHENPPKSLNKNWKKHPENRYPVCNYHHEHLHTINTRTGKLILDDYRKLHFPEALERILNEHKD